MHELPLKELLRRLAEYDEMTILELLEIDSSKLVVYLEDAIAEQYEELLAKLPDDDDEEDTY